MDYATLSLWTSVAAVVLLLADGWIALRRTHRTAPPLPTRAEPALVVLLLAAAVATLVGSLTIGVPELANLAKVVGSAIRGVVLTSGLWLFAWYWQVRETWLPAWIARRVA